MGLLSQEEVEAAIGRISFSSDPAVAAADADVLSESVPEILGIKRETHALFDKLLPPHAVQTTNTSHLLVSDIEDVVSRGGHFAALHFHGAGGSVVDIMCGPRTSDETVDFLVKFSLSIGEIPNVMKKEKAGYIYNNLLGAMLRTALTLVIEGCAEPHEVDRIYMLLSGLPHGPFGIMDAVGLNVMLDAQRNLAERDQPATREQIAEYLQPFVERGELGMKAGKGFYDYPEPAYQKPDFLTSD
jgi:3-hydroxybutyryl-CoA dehydrogenase